MKNFDEEMSQYFKEEKKIKPSFLDQVDSICQNHTKVKESQESHTLGPAKPTQTPQAQPTETLAPAATQTVPAAQTASNDTTANDIKLLTQEMSKSIQAELAKYFKTTRLAFVPATGGSNASNTTSTTSPAVPTTK